MKFNLATALLVLAAIAIMMASWPKYGSIVLMLALVASVIVLLASCLPASPVSKKHRRIAIASAFGIATFVLSIGPATRFTILKARDKHVFGLYRTIYLPVTDFIAILPEPIPKVGNRYVGWWLPHEVQIDEEWPKQEQFLVSWTEPNGKYRIGHGLPRASP